VRELPTVGSLVERGYNAAMLQDSPISTLLPTTDVDRAVSFYRDQLCLPLVLEGGPWVFSAGGGSTFEVLPREDATKAEHTVAAFRVRDIETVVARLVENGVVFEDYEGTVGHVADYGPTKLAWFKDPDGNILCLSQDARFDDL
jgi:catechol 2,3-dioxygenase-like lactoylglutathione lyase family enzyme